MIAAHFREIIVLVRLQRKAILRPPYVIIAPAESQVTFLIDNTIRSEEHTSELQSQSNLVCRLLLEKKKNTRPHLALCRGLDPPSRRAPSSARAAHCEHIHAPSSTLRARPYIVVYGSTDSARSAPVR